ncbi:MAG: roadblock/LC7 domain-containing protein [Bacteroidetes bacterium]|nr:roadblock/LC7 domain-containing protein [Bacteroidota bacterium]
MAGSLTELSKTVFQEIYADIPETRGIIVASHDGLPLVSDIKGGTSADKLAALMATTISMGRRIMPSLSLGEVSEFTITSSEGRLFIYLIGTSAALCIITPKSVNIGMVFLRATESAKKLSSAVG